MPPPVVIDTDGNGFPDAWELQHFGQLGVDPSADADHDGSGNRMEYLAGTGPTDPTCVFRPQGSFANGIFRMPLQTVTGRSYQIWVTRDLQNWTLQTTVAGDGNRQVFQFDETTVPPGPLPPAMSVLSIEVRCRIGGTLRPKVTSIKILKI